VVPKDELTFEIPNWFEHVAKEHQAARENVVLIDQSSFNKFEIEGPKALEFLNWLAANNIDKPVGSVTYTQLCNTRGTIEADITIARVAEDRFLLVTGTAFGLHDSQWIKRHMPTDGGVSFRDVTSTLAVINVIGPHSRELLEKVTPGDISNQNFRYGKCKEITVGDAPVKALRVTFVGELGYELYIPTEFACHVYETLWDAGQDLGVTNAGYRAINSLHFEKGYCLWGSELTPEYTPYDAGLGFCVSLHKGDFIGRDALAKVKEQGPQWKLCTFTLDAQKPVMLRGSEPIIYDRNVIRVTTSAGFGHTVQKNICYGYIPAEQADARDGFEIESYKKIYTAILEPRRSLYDPERKKILI